MKELIIGLHERSYPIRIEYGCLDTVGRDLKTRSISKRFCIISDETVAALYGKRIAQSLQHANIEYDSITFPAGESSKNLATYGDILGELARKRFDRKDAVIALGGGVTGDLAGFVAASYLRGIDFVQIPTTLLSQVDSSVGGKTGVDLPEGKNLVGAFYQPKAVYIDPGVLTTLDPEEIRGGIAEVIKYGVIRDSGFFSMLERSKDRLLKLDGATVVDVVHRCCQIKAEVVAEDERESNVRRILNFGHTIGHAVEAVSDFSLIHGKAVSIGMVAASRIAVEKGMLPLEECTRVVNILKLYGLPVEVPGEYDRQRIKNFIQADKKVEAGRVSYVLPECIGQVRITDDVDEHHVDLALSPLE